MKKKVKIGVVGVGHLGEIHVKLLKEIEEAELIGVYDIDFERSKKVASEYDCKCFKSLEEIFSEVDAISCCVPTLSHFQIGKKVLLSGKHLFLEKPIATKITEAKILKNISEKKKLIFQIGHIERFNPAIKAVKNLIKNPLFIESERLSLYSERGTDVDVILDLMIHDIDIVFYLTNMKAKVVDAVGVPVLTDKIDIANARVKLENNGIVSFSASRVSREKYRKIRFFQKDMYISVNYAERNAEVYVKKGNAILPYKVNIPEGNPLREELTLFINSIISKKKPPVGADDAIRALDFALKIKRKIYQNLKKVKLV
jgi:predicted dehydrogenase